MWRLISQREHDSLIPYDLQTIDDEDIHAIVDVPRSDFLVRGQSLGHVAYHPVDAERKSLIHWRFSYIQKGVKPGHAVATSNLRLVRSGAGLLPEYYEVLLRRRASDDVREGKSMAWRLIG